MLKTRFPVGRHLQQLQDQTNHAFALPLLAREGPLYCEQLLRLIPGVRASFRGRFGSRDCIVKVFFSTRQHKLDCTAELNGLAQLASAGCRIPEIIYVGPSSDQAASVLVLEWLATSTPLKHAFHHADHTQQTQLLQRSCASLAHQHRAGCLQNDVHHSNFLQLDNDIVCVDGERVQQQTTAIDRKRGNDNLARFSAQWPPRHDPQLQQALDHYHVARWGDVESSASLWPLIRRYRQRQVERAFQLHSTESTLLHDHSQHCSGVLLKEWHNDQWPSLLQAPDSSLELKYQSQQQTFAVQRWNAENWWQRWQHKSAGQRHFRYSQVLHFFEVPSVRTIAYIESWQFGAPRSYALIAQTRTHAWQMWLADRGESGLQSFIALLQQLDALQISFTTTDFLLDADIDIATLYSLENLTHCRSVWRHRRRFKRNLQQIRAQLASEGDARVQLDNAFPCAN